MTETRTAHEIIEQAEARAKEQNNDGTVCYPWLCGYLMSAFELAHDRAISLDKQLKDAENRLDQARTEIMRLGAILRKHGLSVDEE